MTLTQLRRFLALVDIPNFHAASERLHITQPALSQSIQKLEESIGESLFLRGPRGVELTDVGKLLVPRAKLVLKFSQDFLDEIDELKNRRKAHIKLGVAPYFARELFPTAFSRFAARSPDVFVDVREEQTLELVRAIEQGELDMALCAIYDEIKERTTIRFEPLCIEHYSVYARVGHPFFDEGTDSPAALADYPWVVIDRNVADGLVPRFEAMGLPVPGFVVETASYQIMTAIVSTSDHLALIPNDFAQPEVAASRIQKILQTVIDITTQCGIFTHPDAPRSAALDGMIAALREVCAERNS